MKSSKLVKLSPSEERLMRLIPSDGTPVTTDVLAEKFYRNDSRPFNVRETIWALVDRLERKSRVMRSIPRVRKGKRRGPHSIQVWREER